MATATARDISKEDNIRPLLTADQLKDEYKHIDEAIAKLEAEASIIPNVVEDDEDLAASTKIVVDLTKYSRRCGIINLEASKPYRDATDLINDHFKRGYIARLTLVKDRLEKGNTLYLRAKARREQERRDAEAAEAKRLADEAAAKAAEAVKAGDVKVATAAVTQSNALSDFAARAESKASATTSSMATTRTEGGTASLVDHWTFEDLDANHIDLEALRPFFTQTAIEQALRAYIKAGRREITGARIFNDSRARSRG